MMLTTTADGRPVARFAHGSAVLLDDVAAPAVAVIAAHWPKRLAAIAGVNELALAVTGLCHSVDPETVGDWRTFARELAEVLRAQQVA